MDILLWGSAKEAWALREQLEDAKRRAQQADLAKASIVSQVLAGHQLSLHGRPARTS